LFSSVSLLELALVSALVLASVLALVSVLALASVLVLVLALVSVLDVSLEVELDEPQPTIDKVSDATTSPVNSLLFLIF
jgi:uncharacterized protein (DUF58 family)